MPTIPTIDELKERLRIQQEKVKATAKELAAAIRAEQEKKHAALGELFEIIYLASDNDAKARYRVTLATSKLSQTKKALITSIFDAFDGPKKEEKSTEQKEAQSTEQQEAQPENTEQDTKEQ